MTLLEIVFGIAILLLLLAVGSAAWLPLRENMHCRLLAQQILHSLHAARSTALLQQQAVTVCGSSDGKSCDGIWHAGIVIKSEKNIIARKWAISDAHVTFNAFTRDTKITFLKNGQTYQNGRFAIVTQRSDIRYFIVISLTGRARLEMP